MRVDLITVEGYDFISITDYSFCIMPSEHGRAIVKGNILTAKKDEYLNSQNIRTKVIAHTDNEDKKVIFSGLVKSCTIKSSADVNEMTLELITETILLDSDTHIRSFQKQGDAYKNIIDTVIHTNTGANYIMLDCTDRKSQNFLCQYKETDWQFLKRLISSGGSVLYPEYMKEGIKFFVGLPDRDKGNVVNTDYYETLTGSKDGILENDSIYYKFSSRELYDVGEKLIFNNEKLTVVSISGNILQSELVNEYTLMKETHIKVKKCYNKELAGAVLFGKVIEVEKTSVKVSLVEDENDNSGSCYFPYVSVYSSPDGSGWYCMPERGDSIMLKFPSSDEESAYIQNAVHVGKEGGRDKPEVKFFKNKEGKEIRLSPDSLLITNNKGSYIRLSDDDGIEIVSEGTISIGASAEVEIESSSSGIKLISPTAIQMNQNGTQIEISDRIATTGSKVYMS